ncbi:MAG: His/Gly/Thr/Pro-type tRNA ligase C-terminal domain-containing protein, partial [Flavobacteriales bacterium]
DSEFGRTTDPVRMYMREMGTVELLTREGEIAIAKRIEEELKAEGVTVKLDDDDNRKPGWKFAEYEMKGVPLRIAIGPRDVENNVVELARRDIQEKSSVAQEGIAKHISSLLDEIQDTIYSKALNYRDEHITEVNSYDEFKEVLESKGGFISAHWDGTEETEEKIKQETKATIRCILLENKKEEGKCIVTGNPSSERVIFAKAY